MKIPRRFNLPCGNSRLPKNLGAAGGHGSCDGYHYNELDVIAWLTPKTMLPKELRELVFVYIGKCLLSA